MQDQRDELVPTEPASVTDHRVIEWNKDDIDALTFLKVDVLGVGMLACVRRSCDLPDHHAAQPAVRRGDARYRGVEAIWRRADIPAANPEWLAKADAFRDMGFDRRWGL